MTSGRQGPEDGCCHHKRPDWGRTEGWAVLNTAAGQRDSWVGRQASHDTIYSLEEAMGDRSSSPAVYHRGVGGTMALLEDGSTACTELLKMQRQKRPRASLARTCLLSAGRVSRCPPGWARSPPRSGCGARCQEEGPASGPAGSGVELAAERGGSTCV